MQNIWNRIIIILGILLIVLGILDVYNTINSGLLTLNMGNGYFIFLFVLGFLLIYYSRTSSKLHNHEENKFNFRETDSTDNCLKCKCCDPKSFSECRFFHINIDVNHVCDLLEPQLEEEMLKDQNNMITNN